MRKGSKSTIILSLLISTVAQTSPVVSLHAGEADAGAVELVEIKGPQHRQHRGRLVLCEGDGSARNDECDRISTQIPIVTVQRSVKMRVAQTGCGRKVRAADSDACVKLILYSLHRKHQRNSSAHSCCTAGNS